MGGKSVLSIVERERERDKGEGLEGSEEKGKKWEGRAVKSKEG